MKGVFVLLLFMSSLIAFTNCGKSQEGRMTDKDKLTSKVWTLYKEEAHGVEVPSGYLAITFKEDGSYIGDDQGNSAFQFWGAFGQWYLSDSQLHLSNEGTYTVRRLTATELTIAYVDEVSLDEISVLYFN